MFGGNVALYVASSKIFYNYYINPIYCTQNNFAILIIIAKLFKNKKHLKIINDYSNYCVEELVNY